MIQAVKAFIDNHESVRHVGDTTAVSAALAAFFELLPAVLSNISAICALFYLLIRIYEMFNGKGAIEKWWKKRRR